MKKTALWIALLTVAGVAGFSLAQTAPADKPATAATATKPSFREVTWDDLTPVSYTHLTLPTIYSV